MATTIRPLSTAQWPDEYRPNGRPDVVFRGRWDGEFFWVDDGGTVVEHTDGSCTYYAPALPTKGAMHTNE